MKNKLFIIACALVVIGAAAGGVLYYHIGRHDAQLSYFLVGASRRHNHGIESGLQSPPGGCGLAPRGLAERRSRRLAELQQNAYIGALL